VFIYFITILVHTFELIGSLVRNRPHLTLTKFFREAYGNHTNDNSEAAILQSGAGFRKVNAGQPFRASSGL
jgi:hypothetical protein